jgi:hypothetical protein
MPMKKNEDSPVVQRVREARRLLTEDAGGDFKTYLRNLREHQNQRLAGKSKFPQPGKRAQSKRLCGNQ